MSKEIYCSLEISEKEVRLAVSEYYNTRFNVLHYSKSSMNGVVNSRIQDKEAVKKAIVECLDNVEKKLGIRPEKVILLIPPVNFRRTALKSTINPNSKGLSQADVLRAVDSTKNYEPEADRIAVSRIPVEFIMNGITSKRPPLKEIGTKAEVDVDILCADKEIAYDYVSVCEEAGLEVLDICLDNQAIAMEGALFELSTTRNVILLNIHHEYTDLTYLNKGRILNCERIEEGIKNFIDPLCEIYALPYDAMTSLAKFNGSMDTSLKDVIYIYSKNGRTVNIEHGKFNSILRPKIEDYCKKIIEMCTPIMESGNTEFAISSVGADMALIRDVLVFLGIKEVKMKSSDNIGLRGAETTALLGSFFVEKDIAQMNERPVMCINELKFNCMVEEPKFDEDGDTLFKKISSFFTKNFKEK